MGELLVYGCLTFFSAYGIFSLLFFLKDCYLERKYLRGKCLCSVLPVAEDVCRAENMVKALLFKTFKNDTGLCDRKLIVVNTDHCEATYQALCKLFEAEGDVLVVKPEEFVKKLEKL